MWKVEMWLHLEGAPREVPLAAWLPPTSKSAPNMPYRSRRSSRTPKPMSLLTWRQFKARKLTPAFKELREGGIFTRVHNISCCGSCTHSELQRIVEDHQGKYDGYVGYHAQNVPTDAEEWIEPFDHIHLQHSIPVNGDDIPCPIVVKFVRDVFLKRGLAVDWKGEPKKAILLRLPKAPGPLWEKVRKDVKHRAIFWYWHGLTHHLHADGGPESDKRQRSNIRYDPDAPNAPPEGVTDLFNSLRFRREITFHPPPHHKMQELINTGGYFESEDDNIQNYLNRGYVKGFKFTPPCRYDDTCTTDQLTWSSGGPEYHSVELKGEELDAIAYNGKFIALQSYATLGGEFTSLRTYEAPAGNCFTVAELLEKLEHHQKWIAQCEQHQGKLYLDYCFFEGLSDGDRPDGALVIRYGL